MAYKIPWSNFHELNLDWLLQKVKELREDVDGLIGSATPSDDTPEMDGAGTPGTSVTYSRGDHQHPTDTSRAAQSDLTQEITDRGNADLALASDIADVDAKIKFSSAAPIMDSSSASAGFSDYMARADHIHPTDTSRASATDLAVLQARVDGFTGSALPSDLTPNMDGVGSAGSGGNYSRGDHVHPSDTSKVNKAGDTMSGDFILQGSFIPEEDEKFKPVNAIGWLRIADVPYVYGTRVRFDVVRKGDLVPSEVHSITLAINQNGVTFTGEESASDVLYVDQIRYSNAGKVDIHIDQNYNSDIGVKISAIGPTAATTKAIRLIPFEGVAPAPAGETIVKSVYFHNAAPMMDVSDSISWSSSYVSNHAGMKAYINNGCLILTGFLQLVNSVDVAGAVIATLPASLTCIDDATIMAEYSSNDGTDTTHELPMSIYGGTAIRTSDNYNNNSLIAPTTGNVVRIAATIPLIS